jgi:hypothetical protein
VLFADETRPDLSIIATVIAHSPIRVTSPAGLDLPADFDDVDIAVLEWITAEARRAGRRYPFL